MALSPEGEAFKRYWGTIEASVSVRANTSQLFAAFREAVGVPEGRLPPGAFKGLTELRSAAVQARNAAERFAKVGDIETLDVRTAPQAMWARSFDLQGMAPKVQATFDLTHQFPGEVPVTERRTAFDIEWRPGMTVGDVRSAVRDAAEQMATNAREGGEGSQTGNVVDVANISVVAY